jgi:Uncharacterized protein conserved in bacteria
MAKEEKENKNEKGALKPKWFLRNIIWAAIVVLAIVLASQIILGAVTRHNKELAVPDFTGLSLIDAEALAKKSNVRIDVTDSVFVKRMERGAVFSQNPVAGSMVKNGRRILITINATQPKQVEVPSLVGLSLRQAYTDILSRGLTLGTLTYVPDIATNNVLEQQCKGRRIAPGTKVEAETVIDLTLGLDPESGETYIPHLNGFTYSVAKDALVNSSLNLGYVKYDETVKSYTDSVQAVVYSQSPAFSRAVSFPMGTRVAIYLTMDQSKISKQASTEETDE